MQIELAREDLLKPMGVVAGVVERRQTLPILSYVLLRSAGQDLTLTGTDLEVEVVAHVPARIKGEVALTLPARKLFDICRALPEGTDITIAKQGEKVVTKAGKSRFTLLTLPATDFPAVEAGSFEQALTLSQDEAKRLLDRTAFCMAQQDVRYYLNGLYLEMGGKRIRAVATDGHRMAMSDLALEKEAGGERQVIVPRKGIQELSRLLSYTEDEVKIEIGASHLRARCADVTFTSKLIDGKFPDYTKVIPSSQTKSATIPRDAFREALGRVAILANEKYRGVRLAFQPGRLAMSAHNPEQEEAVEELEVEFRGEALEIGFNVTYLMEAVGAINASEVVIGGNDSNSSCVLHAPGDEATRYIIMPMRL
ncbi:DNA polymerase III subunit beta [Sulfurifustis variabilis]|uniref:Beta sliding clamp n=1 Tax=Sulfurifustis variabilis TaxID=1675686 RepID=A0A1B4V088_9GAMM|nr:DNA polymerase III subunit beta [Sulfurifustis variabilis]BAU46585.1 DNA polymerase III subunit beta [Sulfurifustis variabilis]